MMHIINRLASDWERAALWGVSLVFLCFALVWLRSSPPDGGVPAEPPASRRASILGPGACAFLAPSVSNDSPAESPFEFAYSPIVNHNVGDDGKAGGDRDHDGDNVPPGPEDGTRKNKKDIVRLPPKPRPKPDVRNVRYLGIYIGTEGQRLAALEVRNPKTGGTQMQFLDSGQSCNGIRLGNFDAESLNVLAPDGARTRVLRGAERKIRLK